MREVQAVKCLFCLSKLMYVPGFFILRAITVTDETGIVSQSCPIKNLF